MINLMASLRKRLKAVSLGAWLVCALAVLIGGWLIAVITKPPSAEQLQMNAEHEYYQRYNKFLPGEKTPEYDYKKYHMIKKDGRYFIIPRDYGTFNGVAFYWPSKTPYSLLKIKAVLKMTGEIRKSRFLSRAKDLEMVILTLQQ
jgi:hypothetical protein